MRTPGYLHPDYAASLAHLGEPLHLERAGGWLLRRPVGATGRFDALGGYPLFCCSDWSALAADLQARASALVSVTLVTDPFGGFSEPLLRATFDRVRPYKTHFAIELEKFGDETLKAHHRARARAALRRVEVEEVSDPNALLDTWCSLYAHLTKRHQLTGWHAFSREAFARQLSVPGLVAFAARVGAEVVAMQLWYLQHGVAYSHLTALAPLGYRHRAAYALQRRAIEALAGRAEWLDLGAGAGSDDTPSGLTWFKAGWANATRPAFLCERVLDAPAYDALAQAAGRVDSAWFPRYRGGELFSA